MATWKKVIVSGSNISELNNDAGYLNSLNGTGVFSGSAQINLNGDIKGTADANYIGNDVITNAMINPAAAIDYTKINFAGSNIVSGSIDLSAYTTTASFNAYTSSTDSTLATQGADLFALTGRVTDLETWSASLDTNFVSETEFAAYTASMADAAHLSASQTFVGFNTFSEVTTLDGVTMTSGFDANNQVVINVPTPTNGQDAANKNYVDNVAFTFSQSLAPVISGIETDIANLEAASGSFSTRVTDLEATASTINGLSSSLSTRLTADEQKYDAYTSSFTTQTLIVTSNAAVTGAFGVQGPASFANNVVVEGNLTVNGTASFVNVEELSIKDKFITLASGSNSLTDSGIIFQSSTGNALGGPSGPALFLEATSTGTYGRMAMATSVETTATTATPAAYVNTTETGDGTPPAAPVFGDTTNGYGNMFVNYSTGDIYIYA